MQETPLFFHNGRCELFGILHQPDASVRRTPVVFCHPFGEEKLWSHRVFVSFARLLAARGHTVLRFDYMGNGDSHGSFAESSFETMLGDVRCGIELVKARSGSDHVGLLGLRLGATTAAIVAEQSADVEFLVLWAPIVDGSRYMQDLLRINLTTQMAAYREIRNDREALVAMMRAGATANVDGYEMSLTMLEQVSALAPPAGPRRFQNPCLAVDVVRTPADAPGRDVSRLTAAYARGSAIVVQEEPFWREIERFYDGAPALFQATTGWLETTFTGHSIA